VTEIRRAALVAMHTPAAPWRADTSAANAPPSRAAQDRANLLDRVKRLMDFPRPAGYENRVTPSRSEQATENPLPTC